MNALEISVSVGELLDKVTILKIKQEKIKETQKLKNINKELDLLTNVMSQLELDSYALEKMEELKKVNEELWMVEDQLREYEREKNFSDDFILLARSVYMKNDRRSVLKRDLNLHLRSPIIEEKSYQHFH
ncbi:MAG TPA: DUF6165 family protein [Bacteriovoracaceae bacterium]|nr:DUF6165 family protein [Bacteriovoracaceae bacterium]